MSYSEFPHTNYADYDEKQLIKLYKELVEKYEGTLETATQAKSSVDELKSQYQQFVSQVQTKIDTYTATIDDRVSKGIQDGLSTIRSEFNIFKETLNSQLDTFTKDLNTNFNSLSDKVDTLQQNTSTAFNQYSKDVKAYEQAVTGFREAVSQIQIDYANIQDSVELKIDTSYQNLYAKLEELEKKVNMNGCSWVYAYALGYTAFEWYNEHITCEDWNNSNISCLDWYLLGKEVFQYYRKFFLVRSPNSGDLEPMQNVINDIIWLLKRRKALTAEQYDKLRLRADEALDVTALDADWRGKECMRCVVERRRT